MKPIKIVTVLLPFLLLLPVYCFGATESTEPDKAPKKLYTLPIIFSSPETGLALGAMCEYYPNLEVSSLGQKPGQLSIVLFGAEKGQYVGDFNVSKYFSEGKQWLLIHTGFMNSSSYFYGIGPDATVDQKEKYTIVGPTLNASYLWDLKDHFYLGPAIFYSNIAITDKAPGGLLAQGDITGSDGTTVAGIGINVIWDKTKDFARQGYKVSLLAYDSAKDLGSDEGFSWVSLDYRNYIPISQDRLFAIQSVLVSTNGAVPFEFLPSMGPTLRGIEGARFCDQNYLAFQGEYRFPIRGIFSMAVFGGFGEVAPSLNELNSEDLKVMGGVGFRFALDKEHHVLLRLDVAGTFDNPLVYFSFGEAF